MLCIEQEANACAHSIDMIKYKMFIDPVKVLHPTRHKICHLKNVPQVNLMAWNGKLNLTQQKHTFPNQKKCTTTQTQKIQPGLVVSYDIQP